MGKTLGLEEIVATGVGADEAARLLLGLDALAAADAALRWQQIARFLLRPAHPFALHRLLFDRCFAAWEGSPAPAWVPTWGEAAATNLGAFMRSRGDPLADPARSFRRLQAESVADPEGYWSAVLARLGLAFDVAPVAMLDLADGADRARWLPGARLNIARSCFAGRDPEAVAIVWQGEQGGLGRMTLAELAAASATVAGALVAMGLGPGDAIAVAMPMTPESVVIYLGIVRMGGAVISVADSFAAEEIATRLRIARARAVFTQDVIVRGGKSLPLYPRVRDACRRVGGGPVPAIVLAALGGAPAQELGGDDVPYDRFLTRGAGEAGFAVCDADDVTNVLFSSGTTGEPKAIPWTHVTPIKAAADGWAHHDLRRGDVVCWPTNLGWMMGPWLIYASLLNDATIALYDGSPLGAPFARFVQEAGVSMLGTVPSLVQAWRASGCLDGVDWSRVRRFSSTGEPSTPDDMLWLMSRAGYRPVIEYCGGTEIGGGYICGSMMQAQAPSAFSTPAMGCAFLILDEQGRPAERGELALVPPMLGSSGRLLNRDHHEVYFAGMPSGPEGRILRRHGDEVAHVGGGHYRAQGRVDDTMNLGGIKTSSAEIERVCNVVEGVRETAAIAVPPPEGGPSRLVLFVVADDAPAADAAALRSQFQAVIRGELNPLFKVHEVRVVDALPRTASNKVMRRVLRDDYAGSPTRS